MKFSIKDLFGKCDRIHSVLRNWSHLLEKSLIENLICFAVKLVPGSFFFLFRLSMKKNFLRKAKKNTLVSGNVGDQKNLHPGSCKKKKKKLINLIEPFK